MRPTTCLLALVFIGGVAADAIGQIQIIGETTYPATGHTYFLTSASSWEDANSFAASLGGYLFSVNSVEEMDFVVDALAPQRPPGPDSDADFWIGLNDVEVEGTFVWTSGEPVTFLNWSAGEPNNCCGGEDFGEIWNLTGDRTWNDESSLGGGNLGVIEVPPIPPPAHLQVDLATGYARLTSVSDAPFDLKSYEIASGDSLLAPQVWQTTNLSARGVDAIDPGAVGQHWDVVNAATNQLYEAYLLGKSAISVGESLLLGKIMQPLANGAPQPEFDVTIATDLDPNDPLTGDRTFFDVPVEYVSFSVEGPQGDYNQNGVVDAADYTLWRDTRGATGPGLEADGNSDQQVDQADYNLWKANFGMTSQGAGSFASHSVPEPATWCLAIIGLYWLRPVRSSRRS